MKIYPDTAKLFFEESGKARTWIDDLLKQYRTNTTAVLALATGAATFFGFENSAKGWWFAAAIAAYAGAALLSASILWPRNWAYNVAHDMHRRR
jgi:hypothetical protein